MPPYMMAGDDTRRFRRVQLQPTALGAPAPMDQSAPIGAPVPGAAPRPMSRTPARTPRRVTDLTPGTGPQPYAPSLPSVQPPRPLQPPSTPPGRGGLPLPLPPPPVMPAPPTTPAAPPAANVPGFDTDFESQAFTPGEDPRLRASQTGTDEANAAYQTGRYRPVTAGENDRTAAYGTAQDDALASLGGPNRTELANQALADFDTANAEGLRERYRQVGQNAAKFGRLGMGDTGKQAIDVGRQFEQDRMLRANELARSVAEGDIGDRFRRVGAVSGLRGQEEDINAGRRGETRADQLNARADEERRVQMQRSLEDQIFGQGQQNRGEYRTERDYQQNARERERQYRLQRARALMEAGGRVPSLEDLLGAA